MKKVTVALVLLVVLGACQTYRVKEKVVFPHPYDVTKPFGEVKSK